MATPGDDLRDYEAVVAVCGGISAYKVCTLVSRLVQRGAGVTVAMTESAARFVGPTTFQALTAREVLTNLFTAVAAYDPQHIRLTDRADVLVIAPATANMIGKVAGGICDDLVSTLVVAAACPIILAPAMNSLMWSHPAVRGNVAKLEGFGYRTVGPEEGWQACRSIGPGRMAEPEDIIKAVVEQLRSAPPKKAQPGGH